MRCVNNVSRTNQNNFVLKKKNKFSLFEKAYFIFALWSFRACVRGDFRVITACKIV